MNFAMRPWHRILRTFALTVSGLLILALVSSTLAQTDERGQVIPFFGSDYQADKQLKRADFAKALASFLEITGTKKETCFKDITKDNSLAPTVCALKKAKIFTGSKNTKFRPTSKVTWGFALTTLCRAHDWTKKKTLASCTSYAKKQGLLNKPLSKKIRAGKMITYGELALLMARSKEKFTGDSDTSVASNDDPSGPSNEAAEDPKPLPPLTVPPREAFTGSFTVVPEQPIPVNFFANVVLTAPLPNHFYKDEVYLIEGNLDGTDADEVFVFLCRDGQGCDDSIDFLESTNGAHFAVPVYFEEAGNFQLGIIPGRSGQSRVVDISVLPDSPAVNGGETATQLSAAYQKGKTVFSWNGSGSLTRLVIFQDSQRRDYLFRQNTTSYAPRAEDFGSFTKGEAGWLIELNGAQSAIQRINVVAQDFRKIEDAEIEVKTIKETFSSPEQFTFTGRSRAPISKKAAFTLPNGQVEQIEFSANDVSAGKDIKIEKELTKPGTYIFEVNNPSGAAVVNIPIYVGDVLPLLPDFFSTHPPKLDTAPLANLTQARQKLLSLINADRAAHDLPALQLSDKLNTVAQGHSDNMVAQNFFGHVDPEGLSPDDRRKAAGYAASIRENLGKATSLELVEAGLMRSPIHREAILDPTMTRVGLGIAKNSEGYFIVTQNFSGDVVKASDLPTLEDSLFEAAKNLRESKQTTLSHDTTLRSLATSWSSRMADENFFSITDPQGKTLIDSVRDRGIRSAIQVHIVKVSEKADLEEELLKQSGRLDESNQNAGIGLGINEIGELFMTNIYTP